MNEPAARTNVVLVAVAFEGGAGVVALALGWLMGQPPLETFDWTSAAALWGLLAILPLLVGMFVVARQRRGPLAHLTRFVRDVVVPLFRDCTLAELALISIAAGVGEEMLFRGVLQGVATRWLGSPTAGLVLASVIFGLAHPLTRTYAVLAGIIGMYLGGLWLATGNLLTPIVTHAAYDFIALIYVVRQNAPHDQQGEAQERDERLYENR